MSYENYLEELATHSFSVFVANGRTTKLHGHEFLEVSYITQGSMEHYLDGQRSVLSTGDYFIVDYGTRHAYHQISEESLQVVNLLFYPGFLDRTLSGSKRFEDVVNSYLLRFRYETLRSSPTGKAFHDEDGKIRSIVDALIEEYQNRHDGYLAYSRCLLVEMLILTMRKIGSAEQAKGRSEVITQIMKFISEHYWENICLTDLARQYNYSVSHLSRKFQEETGVCFSAYLQRIRIEQSCRMLENKDLKISQIAARVGYGDIKFFNKVFRATLGITPSQFRHSRDA